MEQPKSYDDLVKGLGMQIEAGKYYRTRSGGKVGPLKKDHSWFVCDGFSYRCNGERMSGAAMGDLIAEWTEDQHEGTVSLDTHALPDAIIPTMSPAEALQELDLREREDDPMHGLSVGGFVDAYKSATDKPADHWDRYRPKAAPGYGPLFVTLLEAHDQAAIGKGRDRHANGKPFLEQPIMEIGRMVGVGYQTGQAMKKAQEAMGMLDRDEHKAAMAELLGAMNYLAAAYLLVEEKLDAKIVEDNKSSIFETLI